MSRAMVVRYGAVLLTMSLAACEAEEAPEADLDPVVEVVPVTPAAQGASMPSTAPVEGGAVLTVAKTPEHGQYVADATGRALYLLEKDTPGSSSCYDACADTWPPLLAEQGTPTAGAAEIAAGMIGTMQRRNGTAQVTYNGHPLYYYAKDQGPAKATGQDVHDAWGEWYLVTPSGEELEEHEAGS